MFQGMTCVICNSYEYKTFSICLLEIFNSYNVSECEIPLNIKPDFKLKLGDNNIEKRVDVYLM